MIMLGASARAAKLNEKRLKLRRQYWPDIPEEALWHRKKTKGFITIPRTMPLLLSIMDDMSKHKPLSSTYFALWCRTFDECMVNIPSADQMAFEAGFGGQRGVQTWKFRMQTLVELGFIMAKAGANGPFSHVLILNPYLAIRKLKQTNKAKMLDTKLNALISRANEIGAPDFEIPLKLKKR